MTDEPVAFMLRRRDGTLVLESVSLELENITATRFWCHQLGDELSIVKVKIIILEDCE